MESFLDGKVILHPGDCRDVVATLSENSIDSCVCDPPYALVSIVKRFGKTSQSDATQTSDRTRRGADGYARLAKGFMGKEWDNGEVAFDPEFWKLVYRVLKPGAHLVAFGGTRTYHRMACAIEDAGFEIRDQLQWMYGQGFPKSLDVSKQLDKAVGAEREFVAPPPYTRGKTEQKYSDTRKVSYDCDPQPITAPATAAAIEWQGWGTALKPACEPIVLARKPLSENTVTANVLRWGTGALNIDGCRVDSETLTGWGGKAAGGDTWNGDNCGLAKDGEARPVNGRWPANVIHDGSEEVVGAFPESGAASDAPRNNTVDNPVSDTHPNASMLGRKRATVTFGHADAGGSTARFFYTAKANSDDRLGSKHPTVKPLDLMQYLVRLVTPKGGTVLDPFAGTGTTGEAAFREGMNAVLIEREEEYQNDIRRRMALCLSGTDERARESVKARHKDKPIDHGPLFGGTDESLGGADRYTGNSRTITDDARPNDRPDRTEMVTP